MATLADAIRNKRKPKDLTPESMWATLLQAAEKVIDEKVASMEARFTKTVDEAIESVKDKISGEVKKEIKAAIDSGLKGKPGKDGFSPKLKDVVEDLLPRIPIPKDGETPNKHEIARDVLAMMPVPKDGISPDVEEVARKAATMIPTPKDGSPDTPDEIVDKLNTLEEALDTKVVRGLQKFMRQVETALRERRGGGGKSGGGGMGLPQHETKNISAGTTSVQTNYPIAANGTAIFNIRYEGSVLAYTAHFTVASDRKTINFVAAVQAQFLNDTKLDITYIRG